MILNFKNASIPNFDEMEQLSDQIKSNHVKNLIWDVKALWFFFI